MVACTYLATNVVPNKAVVLLTILASAASVLTGLFLRLILCCVIGVDAEGGSAEGDHSGPAERASVELDVNPVFAISDEE